MKYFYFVEISLNLLQMSFVFLHAGYCLVRARAEN